MSQRVRVTVEYLEDPDRGPLVLEYDNVLIRQERGLHMVTGPGEHHTFGQYQDIQPNGHHRASILLWTGSERFHDFKPKTEGPQLVPEPPTNP